MEESNRERVGLVLSGGGMRGAYEAGVIQGIVEVLGKSPKDSAPFQIVSGTSVGAINAVWVGAWAHRGDLHADGLRERWMDLELATHLRVNPRGVASILGGSRMRRALIDQFDSTEVSLLEPGPFEHLVEREVPWGQLHRNVERREIEAVGVAALEVSTGRTIVFGEISDAVELETVEDPSRSFRAGEIRADHVLASAAIPLLFPAREINYELFCDGGLRLNTPIPPAIRTGADRIVVISVGNEGGYPNGEGDWARTARRANFGNPIFIAGKALNALLVDPVHRELQVTRRINRMIEAMEGVLDDEQLAEVQEAVASTRGSPYRRVPTLSFTPSENVARLARKHMEAVEPQNFSTRLLVRLAGSGGTLELDLLSFIFFDSGYGRELIELGRRDAHDKAKEIRGFFPEG